MHCHAPPGDLPDPGMEPVSLTSPALAGGFFTTGATWEALRGVMGKYQKERASSLWHEGCSGESRYYCAQVETKEGRLLRTPKDTLTFSLHTDKSSLTLKLRH